MITVEYLDNKELYKLVYGGTSLPIDRSVFKRIKYFDVSDVNCYSKKTSYFVVLKEDETIIGLAKIAHYSMDNLSDNEYSLGYLSIDIKHRNKGYTRLMCDEMFSNLKQQGLELRTSSYTYAGFIKLRKLLNFYSEKHNVKFYDKSDTDYLITPESMYDSNLNMIGEFGN